MADVLKWLRTATKLVFDPKQEERIASQAVEMWKLIAREKAGFKFDNACTLLGVESQDVFTVRERVYQNALQKAWSNGEIDVAERKSLNIIADLLKLPAERRRELEWAACSAVFNKALSLAFSGDHVTDEDCKSLTTIAAGYGKTTSALLKQSFEAETSSFLGRQLNRLSSGSKFGTEEWKILVSTATRLGLSENDLREAVFDQSKALVEKLLAYSKSDGVVTKQEYEELIWLVETLGMPEEVRSYVDAEVAAVNAIEKIREGHLPTVPAPRSGLQLKAGEILHHTDRATSSERDTERPANESSNIRELSLSQTHD